MRYAGYVQCFCNDKFLDGDQPEATYGDKQDPICLEYYEQIMPTLFITTFISVGIVLVNVVLKKITIFLVSRIGYDTYSEIMTKITNGVLLVLFLNTGILILLVNANLSEIGGLLGSVFHGSYHDYSPEWYGDIGNILVHTMFLNAFMPIIFEVLACLMKWFFISKDSGMWCKCGKRRNDRFYSTK